MFYNYLLYGLKFRSDIKLFNIPELEKDSINPDVNIYNGNISNEDIPGKHKYFYLSKNSSYIKFKYGFLRVNFGKEIVYSIEKDCPAESVTPFIMGWGMALVLTQNGYSAFHCSALVYNDQAFFVSGISGAGKSTTSLELIQHGCKYLSDDIAIINSFEDMLVPPSFPIQKVCPDVSINLSDNLLYEINNDRGKYSYLNLDDFCNTSKRLKIIFVLLIGEGDEVEIKEITGIWKYMKVLECLFLGLQYTVSSLPEEEKYRCLKIAGSIKLYTITRPKNKDTLHNITNTILRIIKQGD